MHDPDLLEALTGVAAQCSRFDVILDGGRDDVLAGRFVDAVGIDDGRRLCLRIAVGASIDRDHVDHGERRAAAARPDDYVDLGSIEDLADVLNRTIGHELVVERNREFDFAPQHAALGIDAIDRQFDAAACALSEFVVGPGERAGVADFDGLRACAGGCRHERHAERAGDPGQGVT